MHDRPHWLTRERLHAYPPLFAGLLLLAALVWLAKSRHLLDPTGSGTPLACDFLIFWSASHLALSGHAASAYDLSSLYQAQLAVVPGSAERYAWLYPLPFYLLVLPLSLLPFAVSYWVFMLSTLGAYLAALRRLLHGAAAWWCLAGFSAVWWNFRHGQNGLLTAALAGGALQLLPRRPRLAGVLIGLLAIKPQLGLLFPLALLAAGCWSALLSAALTVLLLGAAGLAVFGVQTWDASLAAARVARALAEVGGPGIWDQMPSAFAMLRMLGASVSAAYAVQALCSVAATAVVWRVWRRHESTERRGAALMTASMLASPYLLVHDTAWLAFPIAWVAGRGLREGWRRGERDLLVLIWLLPLLTPVLAALTHLQVAPLLLGALLWWIASDGSRIAAPKK